MNITDPIARHARSNPGAQAVVHPDGPAASYRELDRTLDALAARLVGLGVTREHRVGMTPLPPYSHLLLRLALARLGVANGILVASNLPIDLCFVANGTVPGLRARPVVFDPAWAQCPPASVDVPGVPANQDRAAICGIFPSSGTTGVPKLVAISHDLMERRLTAKERVLPLPRNTRQICTVGMGSYYGFSSVLRVLWAGGTAVLERPDATMEQVVASITRHRVNHFLTAPMTLERISASVPPGEGPLPSLETVEVGGSLMPARLHELAQQRICATILTSYGAMEVATVAAASVHALEGKPGAVGYLLPGVDVQAVDANDAPLPPGVPGLLRVRSDTCAQEYIGDAAASARHFRNGWFYPGDVGTVSDDRLLSLTGRASEVINSGGNKISPQVIEDVLLSVPEISEAAAFGVPDALGVTRIWAAMVTRGPVDSVALYELCVRRLGPRAPKFVMKMDELPRNEAGKILRQELTRLALEKHRNKADRM